MKPPSADRTLPSEASQDGATAAPDAGAVPRRTWALGSAAAPLILVGLFALSRSNYLLYHSAIELLAASVAMGVFVIGWNSRSFARDDSLLLLAVSFPAIAVLDVLHTLAYKGMGVFPGAGGNLPTQLWIAARSYQSVSFVLAATLLGRRSPVRPGALLATFGLTGAALIATILPLELFPTCYVEGQGLTSFKIGAECVISGLFATAALLYWRRGRALDPRASALLATAALTLGASELSFTLYADVYGGFNFLGHVLKLTATGIVYVVLVRRVLVYPYRTLFRDLTRSQAELRVELGLRRQAEGEAREAQRMAEKASRAKSEFLAGMSHEIRTPMNGIVGMTDLVLSTAVDPEQRRYLEMVRTSADSLLGIINDILDFSKIEAGRLDFDELEFDLRRTVGSVTEALALQAREKGIELTSSVCPDLPAVLVGDPGRLRQVLTNLIGNAVKFTEQGWVKARVEPDEADSIPGAQRLRFSVSDSGIGVSSEQQEHLFESFVQGDGSITRRFGGTGLGLAISRKLVERMGGEISVESSPGRGSTFSFTAVFGVSAAPANPPDPVGVELAGLRVLVVDDHDTNRAVLREMLTNWGMDVVAATGGVAAIRSLGDAVESGHPFRLALLDEHMPEMDGFQVAERIRSSPILRGLSLVVLASDAAAARARWCRDEGIGYLPKPLKQADLYGALAGVLGRTREKTAPTGGPATAHPGVGLEPSAFDGPTDRPLRILVAEDNEVNRALVLALLKKRGWRATAAHDGREALEALDREEFDLVLMDVQMPRMDGYEVTRRIRERERQGRYPTPIVGLTAYAMPGDREKCLEAGMDEYLPKPVIPEDLFATVLRCVRRRPGEPQPHPPASLSKLLGALSHDRQAIGRMIGTFLADSRRHLEDLRHALEGRDAAGAQRVAHSLRGAALLFDAHGTVSLAQRLEVLVQADRLEEARHLCGRLAEELEAVRECLHAHAALLPSGTA